MVDVKVAVVVTIEVEASLEVFLIKVIIIIGISALIIEAFFENNIHCFPSKTTITLEVN